jgi:hypothetical protein
MKTNNLILSAVLLLVITGCATSPDCRVIMENTKKEFDAGNFSRVKQLTDSLKTICKDNESLQFKADSLAQIAERILIDFPVGEEQIYAQIEKLLGSFTPEEKSEWERKGWLEWRLIDGKKMYFQRASSNLILIKKFYEQKEERLRQIAEDPDMALRLSHTEAVYKAAGNKSNPVVPVTMKINYTITVKPDAVPEGEIIRCWLPWPKNNLPRQQKTELTGTSVQNYIIAPDTAIHSTIYMEEVAKKSVPTVFQISFTYQSSAQNFNLPAIKILPYEKSTAEYKKYTSEQPPQICFTENIKRLADSITGQDKDAEVIVRKIYYWFKENIPWTGALEYSIMPSIPEYVYENRRGDCGMQTFLFISMLRYKGVPVRWQSGWMVPPQGKNLHDWCEVFYEGAGWVPADVSYDLQKSEVSSIREFFLSGIDSYRLIINEGISGPLHPAKQFMRSEPYDFQRGEVEWRGGNLYFDKWNYNMNIEYSN